MLRTQRLRHLIGAGFLLLLAPVLTLGVRPLAEAAEPHSAPGSSPLASQLASSTAALVSHPCGGSAAAQVPIRHVVWIWMENHSYQQVIGSHSAPYENALASACGLALNYHAIAHPSLPNYLAATGGSTFGITGDRVPPGRTIKAPSIFSELTSSGRQWRTYVESMPGNCRPTGVFGFGRNPARFFNASHPLCSRWDVPLGTPQSGALATALRSNTLPAFSMVVPNLCHATHSCPVSSGDAWLSRWVSRIVSSPSYRHGGTAVFLAWDEGKRQIGQRVPLIVVSPTTVPGTTSRVHYTHYSLLRTTAQLLGVVPPGHAASATSLRTPFGL